MSKIVRFTNHVQLLIAAENESDALGKADAEFERFVTRVFRMGENWQEKKPKDKEQWIALQNRCRNKFFVWIRWTTTQFPSGEGGYLMIQELKYEGIEEDSEDLSLSKLSSISDNELGEWFDTPEDVFRFAADLPVKDFTVLVNNAYWHGTQPDDALIFHLDLVEKVHKEIREVDVAEKHYEPVREPAEITTRLFLRADNVEDALTKADRDFKELYDWLQDWLGTMYRNVPPYYRPLPRSLPLLKTATDQQIEGLHERFIQWIRWAVSTFPHVKGGCQQIRSHSLKGNDERAQILKAIASLGEPRSRLFVFLATDPVQTWTRIFKLTEEDFTILIDMIFDFDQPEDALIFHLRERTVKREERRKVEVEINVVVEEVHYEIPSGNAVIALKQVKEGAVDKTRLAAILRSMPSSGELSITELASALDVDPTVISSFDGDFLHARLDHEGDEGQEVFLLDFFEPEDSEEIKTAGRRKMQRFADFWQLVGDILATIHGSGVRVSVQDLWCFETLMYLPEKRRHWFMDQIVASATAQTKDATVISMKTLLDVLFPGGESALDWKGLTLDWSTVREVIRKRGVDMVASGAVTLLVGVWRRKARNNDVVLAISGRALEILREDRRKRLVVSDVIKSLCEYCFPDESREK